MKTIPATKQTLQEDWIGSFIKYDTPILKPKNNTFYSEAIFNPTVVKEGEMIYMLFRGKKLSSGSGWSEIGLASSKDGIYFDVRLKPVISPEYKYEKYGCQDPRIVKFGKTYYLTYNGASGKHGERHSSCLATSKDLTHWKKYGLILTKDKFKWNSGLKKAGVIVPKKINGKYVMYFLGQQRAWHCSIGIAYSDDLIHWHEEDAHPIMLARRGHFDSMGVEPGPTPIITKEGILYFYNGWDKNKTHKTGAVLLSKRNPRKILKRTKYPILEPTENWEERGIKVTFSEGLVRIGNKYYLYYGAADIFIGLAISKKEGLTANIT